MASQGWVDDITKTGYVPRPEELLFVTMPRDIYADEGYDGDIPCITRDGRIDWFQHHPLGYPEDYQPSVKSRSYEVAFLEKNVPGPTYLELPLEREILEALASRQYTVLGISAFTWAIPWAIKMAELAKREYGIKEVWLGGYGIMTPEPGIRRVFDRLFWGYAEGTLRSALGMPPIGPKEMSHPELVNESTYLSRNVKVGHLFWERGCTKKCTFCADPIFQPGGEGVMALDEVRRTIELYREQGCASIHLINQDVRPFSAMGKQVVALLHEYKMPFTMMTSLQAITVKGADGLKWLRDMGLTMAQLGVESLDDGTLTDVKKLTNVDHIENTVKVMDSARIRFAATYIIGFEKDTPESITQARLRLGALGPIYVYFSVLLPMPGTPVFYDLHKRGLINDWNWRRWTGAYLVWKHPHMTPDMARVLLRDMDVGVNTPLHNTTLKREWARIYKMKERLGLTGKPGLRAIYYPPDVHEARLAS